jgi:hypothetical protein
VLLNFAGMALVGFCLFGPDTLISGAAAQDLGGKTRRRQGRRLHQRLRLRRRGPPGAGDVGASRAGSGGTALFYVFVALALVSSLALLIGKRPATEGNS